MQFLENLNGFGVNGCPPPLPNLTSPPYRFQLCNSLGWGTSSGRFSWLSKPLFLLQTSVTIGLLTFLVCQIPSTGSMKTKQKIEPSEARQASAGHTATFEQNCVKCAENLTKPVVTNALSLESWQGWKSWEYLLVWLCQPYCSNGSNIGLPLLPEFLSLNNSLFRKQIKENLECTWF